MEKIYYRCSICFSFENDTMLSDHIHITNIHELEEHVNSNYRTVIKYYPYCALCRIIEKRILESKKFLGSGYDGIRYFCVENPEYVKIHGVFEMDNQIKILDNEDSIIKPKLFVDKIKVGTIIKRRKGYLLGNFDKSDFALDKNLIEIGSYVEPSKIYPSNRFKNKFANNSWMLKVIWKETYDDCTFVYYLVEKATTTKPARK